jgi:error-prone DNA polymerase
MQLVRRQMKLDHVLAAIDLEKTEAGRVVDIAGIVVIRQRPMTAKGFIFITLEDETGFANIVVKPAFTTRFRKQIMFSSLLLVRGIVEKNEGVINVIGHRFTPLELTDDQNIHIRSRDWQ